MRTALMTGVVWLLGTAGAWAMDLTAPETLIFDVMWGPLRMGQAQLSYAPQDKNGYAIEAKVVDSTPLIEMNDVWTSSGRVVGGKLVSGRWDVKQRENKYKADKAMIFDAKAKRVRYVNYKDPNDKAAGIAWDGVTADVLATVYSWRAAGAAEVTKGGKLPVVGLKRSFELVHNAAQVKTVKAFGKTMNVYDVTLTMIQDGKAKKDSWSVRLRDDGRLTPLEIVANTKFGSFRAILKE